MQRRDAMFLLTKLLGGFAAGAALATSLAAPLAHAQEFPAKPFRFVVPYPAGGSLDAMARILGNRLSESTKQQWIVENKPGAGGNIGADFVAKSAPDGYTVLMGAVATHAINPALYPKMPYDAQKDFVPLTPIALTPNVLILHPSIPAKNVNEFIAHLKANPGKLSFASGSNGSAGHLAGELFKTMTNTDMVHIPYKGAGPALASLLAGETQVMFDNLANAAPQIKAGKVKALAITSGKRTPLASELPTLAESGLAGFDISTWIGIFLPANTPKPVVDRLHREFLAAMNAPEVKERMTNLGADTITSTPAEFADFIRREAEKYAKVVKASGAKVD
jgi:tripartite-type tricarboxylate transporter receptor subunit TctC